MNDTQLARNLQSVGQACFVKYYDLFASSTIDNAEIVEILKKEKDFTEKSCRSRTSHARSIIQAGLGMKALKIVTRSDSPRVTKETRSTAAELLKRLAGS